MTSSEIIYSVAGGILWLIGVWVFTNFLAIGDVQWWERPLAWFWPATLPLFVLAWVLKEIFWPR